MGILLSGTFIAIMNAPAMYTNICTEHGLKVLEQIMKMLGSQFFRRFSIESSDIVCHDSYYYIDSMCLKPVIALTIKSQAQQWVRQLLSHMLPCITIIMKCSNCWLNK